MANNFSFGNLDTVQETHDALPAGVYQLRAVNIEMKDSTSGGAYVKAEFDVTDGPHKGRKVFETFNVINANEKAVEIALRNIKSWLISAGKSASGELTLERITDLEGCEVTAKIAIERDASGQYPDKNKIARFIPSITAVTATAVNRPEPEAPAGKVNKKPWE